MLPPKRHHPRLDLRGHLMRTRQRLRRTIRQPGRSPRPRTYATNDAPSDGSPEAARHIGHRRGVVQHLEHGLIPLFHQVELHQHDDDLPQTTTTRRSPSKKAQHRQTRTIKCNAATGATVAQLPEPVPKVSPTYRSQHVHHEPGQHRASGVAGRDRLRHRPRSDRAVYQVSVVGEGGFEPPTSCTQSRCATELRYSPMCC